VKVALLVDWKSSAVKVPIVAVGDKSVDYHFFRVKAANVGARFSCEARIFSSVTLIVF
jgi:hypothetical protein